MPSHCGNPLRGLRILGCGGVELPGDDKGAALLGRMMNSDTSLDCAVFKLSPRRSRCELFVSGNGKTEKIASGFLKPFITHLKVADEQAARVDKSIKLELEKSHDAGSWFNKGTLERFVRFVSTPEVLESANTYYAEMLQLEGARRIYAQGGGDTLPGTSGEDGTNTVAAADITKKELLRAIDLRLVTLKQDLATACARACSAGFTTDSVSELLLFAEYFGAKRLSEACNKFIVLCQRHSELIGQQHQPQPVSLNLKSFADGNVCPSSSSDTSIDKPELGDGGAGKPPDGAGLQHHNINTSQPSQLNSTELGTSEQAKPIQRRRAVSEEPISCASSANEPAQQDGGGSFRRLSVQDRINLFENKQKEQSSSSRNITTAGIVNRVVAGKWEHRRLPSDVSEKSVLRRWSGASDMSIDLNISNSNTFNDHKESRNAVGNPTSANLPCPSLSKSEETEAFELKDTATSQCWLDLKERMVTSSSSLQFQCKNFPGDKDCTEAEDIKFSMSKDRPVLDKRQHKHYRSASVSRMEYCGLGNQDASETSNNAELKDHAACHIHLKTEDHVQMKNQVALPEISQAVSAVTKQNSWREQVMQSQTRENPSRSDGVELKDQAEVVNQLQTFERRTDVEAKEVKANGLSDSQARFKISSGLSLECDLQISQSQKKKNAVKMEEAVARKAVKRKEDASHQEINCPKQSFVPKGSVDEIIQGDTDHMPAFPLTKTKEIEPPSAYQMEQLPAGMASKRNQELNDELQMKANELEKLFAAHKLGTLSEQTASSQRSRPVDVQEDHVPMAMEKRHAVVLPDQVPEKKYPRNIPNNVVDFDANFLLKMVGNKEHCSSMNQKFDAVSPSDDSRGKFFFKYMQKRDAKLLEEWETERVQKDAKMKAMRDSLERSQAEMNSRYSGTADRHGSKYTHHHAGKLRSISSTSINCKNQAVDSVHEEGEDLDDLYKQVGHGQHTSYNDSFGDNSSKSTNSLKLFSTKTLSSSTPRPSVASAPKTSVKSTGTVSVKHMIRTENPLAESLSNFSDFRKENAKPSAAINRVNTREKPKFHSRSKSIVEETNLVKEDKPRRSSSMRKSAAIPGELKNLSPLNSVSPGFSKAQRDAAFINKVHKTEEFKQLIRKGKGSGPVLESNIIKSKASVVSRLNKNGEYSEGIIQQEDSPDLDKDLLERPSAEQDLEASDFPVDSDSDKPQHIQEYENSDEFWSEYGDVQTSLSQADYDTAPASPKFSTSAGNTLESAGESPRLWNPHLHNSFPYVHEASNIDAFVDSPVGSPASWNLHPLNQMMETDAARTRKKWGSAPMPMIVANASQQSHKDVTKGFKRLLKFGRKSRGAETLVTDWVSASTASEGDDDTEDGHDLATRPADDLRKSRMGCLFPHDGFNEGEIFPEQAQSLWSSISNPSANFKLREDPLTGSSLKAPRSFFSLSSFRSKESKPR
ncbi:uncharacterized protein LOC108952111 isoform X1 [Musa acuminata AAA Group]|uniref:uncharacterized protein LOC108952111 isoform X1 n=2 Tax=Musa acuminata AAA Group TaxID=214697 RepID=UPI0031E0963C